MKRYCSGKGKKELQSLRHISLPEKRNILRTLINPIPLLISPPLTRTSDHCAVGGGSFNRTNMTNTRYAIILSRVVPNTTNTRYAIILSRVVPNTTNTRYAIILSRVVPNTTNTRYAIIWISWRWTTKRPRFYTNVKIIFSVHWLLVEAQE
jgi:hypothetical protein